MALPRLDQLLPSFSYGDAIGNHVLALRDVFRRKVSSDIFARLRHPRLKGHSRDYADYLKFDSPENICFFHFSIGSPLTAFYGGLRARKIIIYHNVTPAEYLRGVNRRAELDCRRGREELRSLSKKVELALAVSEFNRSELEEMGFSSTAVLPIIMDFSSYDTPPRKNILSRFGGSGVNVLHVGRFVPNKKIEDVVKSFYFFKKAEPTARLFLVGTDVNFENYSGAVKELVIRMGLDDVYFPGHVDFQELCTYYRMADLYLHMSEHEGFCVPLLEAMRFDVPVLAYASSAVPDTLGEAGMLVYEKRFEEIAEMMQLLISDGEFRRKVVSAGRRRLSDFAPEKISAALWKILDDRRIVA